MSVRSPGAALLAVAALILLVSSHAAAQDPPPVEAVALTVTPVPTGNLTVPGETGIARVDIAAVCKLPSALTPGLTVEHSVEIDGTFGSASVKPPSQTVTFEPAQCVDGTPTTYSVEVEFSFVQTAPYDTPVTLTLTSQPKLEGNPATAESWTERPDIAGSIDIQQEYNATVRTGVGNEVGFWVVNKLTNSAVDGTAKITTQPAIGEVTFNDGGTVEIGGSRLYRFVYTPDKEGTDTFVAAAKVTIGDREVATKNLTYEMISDKDAAAGRIDPGVRNSPGPGAMLLVCALGALALLRRRG